jgi:hypothetical protein
MKRQGEEEKGDKGTKKLFFYAIEILLILTLDSAKEIVFNLFLLKCKI